MSAVQLVVTYSDHSIGYYSVSEEKGWRIDGATRCIVIGKGDRTYIPLDNVVNFSVQGTEWTAKVEMVP